MSSTNFVNYETLTQGVSVYNTQSQNIVELMGVLASMNEELEAGWQNETARAFIEMYNNTHKPALQSAATALAEISSYINSYMEARQNEDAAGAAGIRM